MYCRHCGKQIDDDAAECPYCRQATGVESESHERDNDRQDDFSYKGAKDRNYYEAPPRYDYRDDEPPVKDRRGFAIASLVLGILNILSCCFPYVSIPMAVIGLVLGILGLKSSSKGLAIAGIVLSSIGLLLTVGLLIMGSALLADETFMNEFYREFYSQFN